MAMDVLIVGAGPTGLTLALDLARRGVSCRVIDKAEQVGSRGRGMQPRTLEVMDDFGLIDAVFANGSDYPPVRMYQGERVVWEGLMSERTEPSVDVPYPIPWMIPQYKTTELLRGRLAGFGIQVEAGTELTGFEQDEDGVTATLNGTEQARVAYLVGADGGRGPTRRLLGVPFEGVTTDDIRMLVADVKVAGLDRDYWHMWRHENDVVGLCPLGGTDAFQLVISNPNRVLATAEDLEDYVAERTGRPDIRLSDLTWVTEWRPNIRMATRFQVGRVFLAGDAAHVHPPTGGQGMNTGVQDAYNLGWKLAAVLGGAPASLLATYEQERLPVAAHVLGLSERLLDAAVVKRDEEIVRRGQEERQLGITYRGGSLAVDDRAEPGSVAAGDRAPNAPVGDGRTMFDVFRGPQFTLLGFGTEQGTQVTDPVAYEVYDVTPGTYVLVRPDGYVGVITREHATVADYLVGASAPGHPRVPVVS
jgi:2-polyprenyl-6-methoxyphenol hydroxylase-like FAD-dependent oxidoreductase